MVEVARSPWESQRYGRRHGVCGPNKATLFVWFFFNSLYTSKVSPFISLHANFPFLFIYLYQNAFKIIKKNLGFGWDGMVVEVALFCFNIYFWIFFLKKIYMDSWLVTSMFGLTCHPWFFSPFFPYIPNHRRAPYALSAFSLGYCSI